MATLYTHKDENVAKTWGLMSIFFVIVILVGWAISWYLNSPGILLFAVVFAILTNIWSYWNSDKVAIALSGAKTADPQTYPELHRIIENLAITAGLPKPKIFVIEDPAPNAFATGRDANHAAIAATTGLLSMMDRSELEGVFAHELSHIGNKDVLLSTVAVVLVGLLTLVTDFFLRSSLFGWGGRDNERDANPIILVLSIALIILAPIFATLLQLAISRKREFLADASGALLTRYPEGLAHALQKIGSYPQAMERANNATAHLYISNPFGPKAAKSFITRLFSTHPPIEERIKALLEK